PEYRGLVMRALAITAYLLLALAPANAWAGGASCDDPDLVTKPTIAAMPAAGAAGDRYSSFRGISLGSKPGDVAANSLEIGLPIYITTFIDPPDTVASIDICRGHAMVG